MQLDVCRCTRIAVAALDHIGIERALGEVAGVGDRCRFALESFDEFLANDLPFLLRIGNAFETAEEWISRVADAEVDFEVVTEGAVDELAFAFAQQAVVNEDADELLADR